MDASEAVTVRLDERTLAELDLLAAATSQDRASLIGAAVDGYLALNRWQAAHVAEGLRQADDGHFASDAEVATAFSRWR